MMEIEQIIKYRAKMRRLDDADRAASERVIRHRSGGKPKQPLISEEERSKCGRILVFGVDYCFSVWRACE